MLEVSRRGSVQNVSELSAQEGHAPCQAVGRFGDPGDRAAGAVVLHIATNGQAREVRKDAQVARSFRLSLPYELSPEQNSDLVRRFAQHTFVDAGMVVDVTVALMNAKCEPNPFASLLATTRTLVVSDGQCSFGNKVTIWHTRVSLFAWRVAWASEVNASLEAAGSLGRVDHRSMAGRGLDVGPQIGVGVIAKRRHERGLPSDRLWRTKRFCADPRSLKPMLRVRAKHPALTISREIKFDYEAQ